ncbi:MAG TPA: alpha-L-fucosidase [Acidobacteriaceae bacterium]
MHPGRARILGKAVAQGALLAFLALHSRAETPLHHYELTLESLNKHPLPRWYDDAKLGIFIHYGLYSVPGWAPLSHPEHDFKNADYIKNNPYAEWYYNAMRVNGSPTQAYHREHYGADYNYYNFAAVFNQENEKWNPDEWARIFRDAGAKYVVLTTKHHEGFTLWPSSTPNPALPKDRQHAARNIVGELTAAVRQHGMRMGFYYSGGYDWTFVPGPITKASDYATVQPQTEAYGKYAAAQIEELIEKYHPAVLWNDIGWPKTGNALKVIADYYNTVPDGVVDDRFSITHADFVSPEYRDVKEIQSKKWEECRGLGRSFGYNRAEGEGETIAPDKLIYLLSDIVSKNGNLLLDVGPEADGTIPPVQMARLVALGAWLRQNGDAIYGTHPWTHAEGESADGIGVRYTRKGSNLYAIILGTPKGSEISIKQLDARPGTAVRLLGHAVPLHWTKDGDNLKVKLPASLPGKYAYVLELQPSDS